jgi:hypothetical protein
MHLPVISHAGLDMKVHVTVIGVRVEGGDGPCQGEIFSQKLLHHGERFLRLNLTLKTDDRAVETVGRAPSLDPLFQLKLFTLTGVHNEAGSDRAVAFPLAPRTH